MLRSVDDQLWVCEQPLKFVGLAVGARMTVIRLASGGLLVHSPLRATEELRSQMDSLGPVQFLIAPNRYHHLFVGDWIAAYPGAQAWAAPGLPKKRRDLAFHGVLDDGVGGDWSQDVEHLVWRGSPLFNEVVFRHRPTRTLVLTDTVHNLGADRPWWTRTVFRAFGGYGGFKSTVIDRLSVRDRAASRASLLRILAWDFDRVIVSHGEVLESGGPDALRRAWGWLL